jgi:hypothetical protein
MRAVALHHFKSRAEYDLILHRLTLNIPIKCTGVLLYFAVTIVKRYVYDMGEQWDMEREVPRRAILTGFSWFTSARPGK